MRLLPHPSLQVTGRRTLSALALLAAASCGSIGGNSDPGRSRLAEYDVQEAALRWAFANADTDLRPSAVHCLARTQASADLLDPSDTLIARFAEDPVPVRAVSTCDGPWQSGAGRDVHPGVDLDRHFIFDPQTGQPGLLFVLQPVEWEATGTGARVAIEFGQGGLWGAAWSCDAEIEAGAKWRILECTKVGNI